MSRFETDHIARLGFAMGHPRRVALFDLLSIRPEVGNSLAALENASRIPRASLIHHLRQMEAVGLINRKAKGATTVLRLERSALRPLEHAVAIRLTKVTTNGRQTPGFPVHSQMPAPLQGLPFNRS